MDFTPSALMQGRYAMARYRDSGILMLLGAIWGFSYIFIRVAVPAFGPIGLSLARVAVGAVGLLAWAAMRGLLDDVPRLNRTFFILATLNALIPYTLIAFAELHISASLAAILNSTTPLITALLVVFINHERIGRERAVGLALGMAGVGVLVGWSPIPFSGMVVLSVIAMIIASGSYGLAGIYAKRSLGGTSSFSMAVGQQMAATTLLLPIGLGAMAVGDADKPMSSHAIWAIVALGLVCTSFAYLLYFHLITHVGPVRTSSVTFLIPMFGLLWGWLFLDEKIHASMLIGLVLILASVRLVNSSPKATSRTTPAQT